jgi:hypothetical protein
MLLQIKNISPDGKLPRGILLQGKPAIKNGKNFDLANIEYSIKAIFLGNGIG